MLTASLVMGLQDCGRLVWFANGILLSYLLLAPRWLWRRYCIAGFVAILAGGIFIFPHSLLKCTLLTLLNVMEVLIAALALRRRTADLPRFTNQRYLLRFGLCAVLGAPATAAILYMVGLWAASGVLNLQTVLDWITTDGLGTAIVTPAFVSMLSSGMGQAEGWKRRWHVGVAFVAITLLAFWQQDFPVIFLIYPAVALILFQFGLGAALTATLFVTTAGSAFTINGMGPFARIGYAAHIAPTTLLQLYIASGMFLIFSASAVMDALRSTEKQLRDTLALHNLITENSRDVIILADFNGNRSYVSAAASKWGGWPEKN